MHTESLLFHPKRQNKLNNVLSYPFESPPIGFESDLWTFHHPSNETRILSDDRFPQLLKPLLFHHTYTLRQISSDITCVLDGLTLIIIRSVRKKLPRCGNNVADLESKWLINWLTYVYSLEILIAQNGDWQFPMLPTRHIANSDAVSLQHWNVKLNEGDTIRNPHKL